MVKDSSPDILIITETRIGGDRAKEITDRLPFDGAIHTDTIGYADGLWILWNSVTVEMTHLASIEQEIHAMVKVGNSNISWLLSVVYASPRFRGKYVLWNNLEIVVANHNLPGVMIGDFNDILKGAKKFGGRLVNMRGAMLSS